MKIAHLKRSKKEAAERKKEMSKPISSGDDEYPYGTRIRLEKDEMDKIGIKDAKPGDHYEIHGHAKVMHAHQSADEHGENRHVELHITHLGAAKKDTKSIREELKEAAEKSDKPLPREGKGKDGKAPD